MRCSSGIAPVRCAQIPELTIHDVLIPEMMKRHEVCRTGGGERRTPCLIARAASIWLRKVLAATEQEVIEHRAALCHRAPLSCRRTARNLRAI